MKEVTVFVQKTVQEEQFEPFSIALSSKFTVEDELADSAMIAEAEHLQDLVEEIKGKRLEKRYGGSITTVGRRRQRGAV